MALVILADQGKSFSQCSPLHIIQAMGQASGTDREHTKELLIILLCRWDGIGYINQLTSSVVGKPLEQNAEFRFRGESVIAIINLQDAPYNMKRWRELATQKTREFGNRLGIGIRWAEPLFL
ncbi:hypothetical protein PABG_01803 [Paracoccidioides brasiliensis Pb03]|nr:hypothetical protein PABG_01803 [Paracoccidioides brasiliensis Pb03]